MLSTRGLILATCTAPPSSLLIRWFRTRFSPLWLVLLDAPSAAADSAPQPASSPLGLLVVGPGIYGSPRHRMPFKPRNEGSNHNAQCVLMTWRGTCARPYLVAFSAPPAPLPSSELLVASHAAPAAPDSSASSSAPTLLLAPCTAGGVGGPSSAAVIGTLSRWARSSSVSRLSRCRATGAYTRPLFGST